MVNRVLAIVNFYYVAVVLITLCFAIYARNLFYKSQKSF